MEVEYILERAWTEYKKNFWLISLGVVLSLLLAELLLILSQYFGSSYAISLLISSFLMAGIYITVRTTQVADDLPTMAEVMARFILGFALLALLVVFALVIPHPINVLFLLVVLSTLFMAVPIVAELGIVEGCKKVKEIVKKRYITYLGLNWFFFLLLFSILTLAVNPIMSLVSFVLLLFFYLPTYALTGFLLARLDRASG